MRSMIKQHGPPPSVFPAAVSALWRCASPFHPPGSTHYSEWGSRAGPTEAALSSNRRSLWPVELRRVWPLDPWMRFFFSSSCAMCARSCCAWAAGVASVVGNAASSNSRVASLVALAVVSVGFWVVLGPVLVLSVPGGAGVVIGITCCSVGVGSCVSGCSSGCRWLWCGSLLWWCWCVSVFIDGDFAVSAYVGACPCRCALGGMCACVNRIGERPLVHRSVVVGGSGLSPACADYGGVLEWAGRVVFSRMDVGLSV